MSKSLIPDIAKSLLLARWRQTLVAAIGVTFGIATFIALLGFMTGLNKLLDGLVLNRTPHIRLYKEIRPGLNQPVDLFNRYNNSYNFISSVKSGNARLAIYNSEFIMQSLRQDERILGFTRRITAQVFFNNGSIDINGVINGIDADEENKLFLFNDYIVAGQSQNLVHLSNSIILGTGLAERMQVNTGDNISITTARGDHYSLKVAGFFQSGISDFDKIQSYASIATTQKIMGKANDYITDIAIKVKKMEDAPGIAKEYRQLYNTEAEDIQTANAQFETGSSVRLTISYAVGITLLIVAGFGIYNILNMMIYEKMDTIAILKATGFSGGDVHKIFMTIALSIGFFGGIVGLLCGFLLSEVIDQIPFTTTALPAIKTYPVNYDPLFYGIGISFSLLTTWMAGFFPARKAARIDPVVIIRGK